MSNKKKKDNEVLDDLKGIALVMGGVVIGTLVDKGATKVLKLDQSSPGLLGKLKPFISPAVRIVGGGSGAYFVPNKTARLILGGVAISGAASAVEQVAEKILKKSMDDKSIQGMGTTDIDDYIVDEVEETELQLPELMGDQADYSEMKRAYTPQISTVAEDAYEDFDDAEII
jgi:hypothetical protein